mgnify:CR=1 FL=1
MRVQKMWNSWSKMIFFFLIFHFVSGLLLGVTKHSQILLDAEKNIRIIDWSLEAGELKDPDHHWRIRKDVLHGGMQEGVDRVRVDNGVLSFTIIPTRGMSIWEANLGALRLGWDSPVKQVVHPQFVDLGESGGWGWLKGFGAWMNRCGIAFNGIPGQDQMKVSGGAIIPVDLNLHGRIDYQPAHFVQVEISNENPPTLTIRGVVDETLSMGLNLQLTTEISTTVGSPEIRLRDTITNLGTIDQEFQTLYHTNFGAPLLEGGAKLIAAVQRVTPMNLRAAKEIKEWDSFQPPTSDWADKVYFLKPLGNSQGWTETILVNRSYTKGVSLHFSVKELPYLTLWKNTSALEDGYVTGIEPGTNYPNNRSFERKKGRVPILVGGESHTSNITFVVHTDIEGVTGAIDRIKELQGDISPRIDLKPAPDLSPM